MIPSVCNSPPFQPTSVPMHVQLNEVEKNLWSSICKMTFTWFGGSLYNYFVPICKHLRSYSCRLMILNPSTHTAEPLKNIPTVSRNIALCKGIVLMCNFIVLDKFMDLESRKIQVRMIVLSLLARKSLVLIKISEVQFSHEWKE